jgi:hypothetical protein
MAVQTELTDRLRPFAEINSAMFASEHEDDFEQADASGTELRWEYLGPIQGRILIDDILASL